MTAHHTPAPEKETEVHHLNATDHEANRQADGPPGAAVRDTDPPVDGSVATEHQPGPNPGHDQFSALIVTIGDECIPQCHGSPDRIRRKFRDIP
jgi:hypothetical protein